MAHFPEVVWLMRPSGFQNKVMLCSAVLKGPFFCLLDASIAFLLLLVFFVALNQIMQSSSDCWWQME
jgi:hypothetical protein